MIAGLIGTVDSKYPDSVLVNVQGMIYRVGTSGSTLSAIGDTGETVRLQTHLVVREDQLTLYGFATREELAIFETLIAITGIGPRLACAVLSRFDPDRLYETVEAGNATLLGTVPGVGKKTAARLVLELRGKLPESDVTGDGQLAASPDEEIVDALRALGYTATEATIAASKVSSREGSTVEERVVEALRALS
jgi:holliday junction DNA helicase RuvA